MQLASADDAPGGLRLHILRQALAPALPWGSTGRTRRTDPNERPSRLVKNEAA
jgi:hypothetical protein